MSVCLRPRLGALANVPLRSVPGGPIVGIDLTYQTSTYEGGLLHLPFPADRMEVEKAASFVDYMAANFQSWQAYMNKEINDGTKPSPSIILVRGWIKTPQWASAAFKADGSTKRGTLKGGLFSLAGRIEWRFTESDGLFELSNYGPMSGHDELMGERECIFLSYYKIKYRFFRWGPKVMQAAAGPDQLPPPGPEGAGPGALHTEYEIETEDPPVPVSSQVAASAIPLTLTFLAGASH